MNSRYETIIREIDEMLISEKVDRLLKEHDHKNKKKLDNKVNIKKINNPAFKISVDKDKKEEIIELKTKNKKQIIDLYDKPVRASYKMKIVVH